MIEGLSHITLIVRDLEKSSALFKTIFEAKEIYSSEDKTFSLAHEKFFMIGDVWIVIMQDSAITQRNYRHEAFKIADKDYDKYLQKIMTAQLEIKSPRPRVDGEGRSIYFYDYDNNLFELHTGTLQERLNRYYL
jgi:catechol 2,3-dioxygenase-like lactoylglutathione lyase family enzyme